MTEELKKLIDIITKLKQTHVPLSVVEKLVVALKTISDMSEKMDNGCYAIGMYHENVADQALAEFKKYLESLK